MTKRIISLFLAFILVVGLLPIDVFAVSKPTITTQPKSVSATVGSTAKFTVTATNAASYQWQYRVSTSGTWKNATATGNKTKTLSVPVTASRDGYQYRCCVKNAAGTVNSKAATLTVKATPVITTQPADKIVAIGSTAKFTVTASNAVSYQWQYRVSTSGTWKNATATGNKTKTLSVPATAGRNGYQYRCKVTNAAGTTVSAAATLLAFGVTAQPQSVTADPGMTAKFTVKATGAASYQWQYRVSAIAAWKNTTATGNKTATLSVPVTASRSGYQYRCKMTNAAGNTFFSQAATLTVNLPLTITAQPQNAIGNTGDTVSFHVEATGGVKPYTYQWQFRQSGDPDYSAFTDDSGWSTGAATNTVRFQASYWDYMTPNYYRCVITDAAGTTVTSNPAWVINPLRFKTEPANCATWVGKTASFKVEVVGGSTPYHYQWQICQPDDGDLVFNDIPYDSGWAYGWVTDKLYFQTESDEFEVGYLYRCVVTDKNGDQIVSNYAKVVPNPMVVTTQPAEATVSALDQVVTYTAAATGGSAPYTYRWQYTFDTMEDYEDLPNCDWASADGDTLYVVANRDVVRDEYRFRCVITSAEGYPITTSDAGVILEN